MKSLLSLLVLALLLAGCGIPRRPEGAALNEYLQFAGPPVDQVRFFRLDSWEVVGRYQLVIYVTPWEAYLTTVAAPCEQLGWVNRLGVTSTVGTLSKFESVVMRDNQHCPILELRPVDVKALKAHRRDERAAALAAAAPH